jgi:hypothetical protein
MEIVIMIIVTVIEREMVLRDIPRKIRIEPRMACDCHASGKMRSGASAAEATSAKIPKRNDLRLGVRLDRETGSNMQATSTQGPKRGSGASAESAENFSSTCNRACLTAVDFKVTLPVRSQLSASKSLNVFSVSQSQFLIFLLQTAWVLMQ